MMDPQVIADGADDILAAGSQSDWSGRRVLVSAGPTRAHVDPVRFLTNASTGAMGFAMAEAAAARGAEVVLVAGPVDRDTPAGVRRVDVTTAGEMHAALDEVLRAAPQDLVAMVAAVADLVPSATSDVKLPKDELTGAMADVEWTRAPDVLAGLCREHGDRSFFLGFAAETVTDDDPEHALLDRARAKRIAKGCQALFANRVGVAETGFGTATNAGLLLVGEQVHAMLDPVPKRVLAGKILEVLAAVARRGEGT
jgi:phosphopantothenoylcysteine decarboxylase/phosphopantothenate--cysteine ligase